MRLGCPTLTGSLREGGRARPPVVRPPSRLGHYPSFYDREALRAFARLLTLNVLNHRHLIIQGQQCNLAVSRTGPFFPPGAAPAIAK